MHEEPTLTCIGEDVTQARYLRAQNPNGRLLYDSECMTSAAWPGGYMILEPSRGSGDFMRLEPSRLAPQQHVLAR